VRKLSSEVGRVTEIKQRKIVFEPTSEFDLDWGSLVFVNKNHGLLAFKVVEICREKCEAEFCFRLGKNLSFQFNPEDLRIGDEISATSNFSAQECDQQPHLKMFKLRGSNITFPLKLESLLGRHFGIFGATGSGKSWTLARIIEECQKFDAKLILIDQSGEYSSLKNITSISFFGEDFLVNLPFFHLKEEDLFTLFAPDSGTQFMKLKLALKSLKLAKLDPKLGAGGVIIKANRDKREFEKSFRKFHEILEKDELDLEIQKLPIQLQNECVFPQQSASEPQYWGGTNAAELSEVAPLIGRIESIIKDPDFAFIFNPDPDHVSLFDVLNAFFNKSHAKVLRINISSLTDVYSMRAIVLNIICRFLYFCARKKLFLNQPLAVLVDEAHNFFSEKALKNLTRFGFSSGEQIVKEARKFSLVMGIATQQPSEISAAMLSQLGSIILHRLSHKLDLELVSNFLPPWISSADIASLPTGSALLVTCDFDSPCFVDVVAPSAPPRSLNPDFEKGWGLTKNSA